jgi:hypothetical protein
MVKRSAYDQLGYSPLSLALTVVGMAIVYIAPPLILMAYPLHGHGLAAALAALAWLLMSVAFRPTLRLYGQPAWMAPLLPAAGLLYAAMTVDSALAHAYGRGGAWKGRVQGGAAGSEAPL